MYYCRKECREINEFGKLKIKFIKVPLTRFTNKTMISKNSFNTTGRLTKKLKTAPMKTSRHPLQHSVKTTLIFTALLNPKISKIPKQNLINYNEKLMVENFVKNLSL